MEEDEEVADSGGDSNTSTCEREVIERLFGGFVEDIIYIYFIGMCVGGKRNGSGNLSGYFDTPV